MPIIVKAGNHPASTIAINHQERTTMSVSTDVPTIDPGEFVATHRTAITKHPYMLIARLPRDQALWMSPEGYLFVDVASAQTYKEIPPPPSPPKVGDLIDVGWGDGNRRVVVAVDQPSGSLAYRLEWDDGGAALRTAPISAARVVG